MVLTKEIIHYIRTWYPNFSNFGKIKLAEIAFSYRYFNWGKMRQQVKHAILNGFSTLTTNILRVLTYDGTMSVWTTKTCQTCQLWQIFVWQRQYYVYFDICTAHWFHSLVTCICHGLLSSVHYSSYLFSEQNRPTPNLHNAYITKSHNTFRRLNVFN